MTWSWRLLFACYESWKKKKELKLRLFMLAMFRLKITLPNMVRRVCSKLALPGIQLTKESERERENAITVQIWCKLRNILALSGSFWLHQCFSVVSLVVEEIVCQRQYTVSCWERNPVGLTTWNTRVFKFLYRRLWEGNNSLFGVRREGRGLVRWDCALGVFLQATCFYHNHRKNHDFS